MLARFILPPFALQLAFLPLGFALSTYSEWLDGRYIANLSDQSGRDVGDTASFFWVLGVGGMVIFMPLHWLVLFSARVLRISPARLYLVAAFVLGLLVIPLYLIQTDWALAVALSLAIIVVPYLGFLGLTTWAVDAWYRKQELGEQRATEAFVRSRIQKLPEIKKS